jgi:copper(I)-binding protein
MFFIRNKSKFGIIPLQLNLLCDTIILMFLKILNRIIMKKKILCGLSVVALLFCNVSRAAAPENPVVTDDTAKPVAGLQSETVEVKKTLEITEAWARKSMSPNNHSAAYRKINNPTTEQITIIGASASRVANNVELHKSFVDEKGVSRMTSIDKIVVPAGSSIELMPGAIHIMLFDLKKNLAAGSKFDIVIKIEGKDPITIEALVK